MTNSQGRLSEADTRARYIDPQLKKNNWQDHNVIREHYFTDGRKFAGGKRADGKFADYLLKHKGLNLALIEAKKLELETTE